MKAITQLKKQGFRITLPRQEIFNILRNYPLTVREISQTLKTKNILVDLASVYRSLELFKQMGIVQEIDLGDGMKRYELIRQDKHHHHFVCNNCGTIKDISSKIEEKMMKDIQSKTKFLIQDHSLEMFGLCQKCN